MGGNLLQLDDFTNSLLTNPEVIAVDQHSTQNKPVITTDKIIIWTSRPENSRDYYVAVFNIGDAEEKIHYNWSELGLGVGSYKTRDLWQRNDLAPSKSLDLTLRPHSSALFRATFQQRR